MPNRDGTGPNGDGPKTGRGQGNCKPNESTPRFFRWFKRRNRRK